MSQIKVLTCNLNGIRAAQKKGFFEWASQINPDFICLQETKADTSIMASPSFDVDGYHRCHASAEKKGYSGVAIYAKCQPKVVQDKTEDELMDVEGRYIAVEYPKLRVVSLYLPSGTSSQERQDIKMRLCDRFYHQWLCTNFSDKPTIVCGDWNIAHKPIDLRNWKQNQKNSGFLPEERAWLDKVFASGWVDAFREVNTQEHQYTWWTYRQQAREKNIGWRIDYQIISAELKASIAQAKIYPLPLFSDHAPLVIDYNWSLE